MYVTKDARLGMSSNLLLEAGDRLNGVWSGEWWINTGCVHVLDGRTAMVLSSHS